MTVICPKCKTKLSLSDDKLKPEGTRFKCIRCGAVLVLKGKGRRREEEAGGAVLPREEVNAPLGGEETNEIPGTKQRQSDASPMQTYREDLAPKDFVGQADQIAPLKKEEPLLSLKNKIGGYETDKVSSEAGEKTKKGISRKTIAAGSAAGLLILVLVWVFLFRSTETAPNKQPAQVQPAGQAASELPAGAPPQGSPAVPSAAPQPAVQTEEMSSSTPEEKAIEMVKRSDALLKMTTVDSIVSKWTQDNTGKYKLIGWQAKKIDEQKYIVSYTALDGSTPKGFYFVADLQSGGVEDLAHNPELQKKYDVQYAH